MRLRVPVQLCAFLSLATAGARPAAAQRLLVNTNDAGRWVYGGLHYGGDQWRAMTATINGAFRSVTTVGTMTDLSQMLQYDALWVDQRWHATAAQAEIDNMLAFAATGRRVVVMGENATWGGWNSQVLTALGGMEGPLNGFPGAGCMYGRVTGLGTHALTSGVNGIAVACGGYAIGGTQLFAYNVASLWRPEQNVLTILDGNIMDDLFAAYEAPLFRNRVVSWLAASAPTPPAPARVSSLAFGAGEGELSTASFDEGMTTSDEETSSFAEPLAPLSTPEPATVALLAVGAGALGAAARRRPRAD